MKKLSLLLLLSSGLICSQPQLNFSVQGSSNIKPNDVVSLSLNLTGSTNQNISGLQWTNPIFPSVIFSVTNGSSATLAHQTVYCNITQLSCLSTGFAGITITNNVLSDGVLFNFSFTVPSNTTPGNQILSLTNLLAVSNAGVFVPITTNPLTLTVLSLCDLNNDTKVDASDVLIAINQALGKVNCTNDLNGDGVCNVLDVERIVVAALGGVCKVGP